MGDDRSVYLACAHLRTCEGTIKTQQTAACKKLTHRIHQRALEEAPRSDVVDGLAAEAVAQTGTAGFGARAAVGFFVLTASADKHLGF